MGTLALVPRLRGRQAEIAALGEVLDQVGSGRPAVVLIEGEAGIGKSRLLAGVLEDAGGRGMRVAAGRAEELERTRPFGLVAAAFGCARSSPDPRRAAIAALLAAGGSGDADRAMAAAAMAAAAMAAAAMAAAAMAAAVMAAAVTGAAVMARSR